jgi:hypothetical protein
MAQRIEAKDSLDDFPTPPWATRALVVHVLGNQPKLKSMSCLEPACGAGHMAKVLREFFAEVKCSDVHPYGYGDVTEFLRAPYAAKSVDWVITNPPFRLAEDFIRKSLTVARRGVAMLTRTVFIESVGRYERLFRDTPPTKFAQFTERVPMVKGRLDQKASTATGYGWIVWEKDKSPVAPCLVWVPACRKQLERNSDYENASRFETSLVEGRQVLAADDLTVHTAVGDVTKLNASARRHMAKKDITSQEDLFGT